MVLVFINLKKNNLIICVSSVIIKKISYNTKLTVGVKQKFVQGILDAKSN